MKGREHLNSSLNGAFIWFYIKYEDWDLLFVILQLLRILDVWCVVHNGMELAMLFIFIFFPWSSLSHLLKWFLYIRYSVPQLCLQELTHRSWALFQNILKPLRTFSVSGLWRKPCFSGKNTTVWCLSWDPGPETLVSDSGKSQRSVSLLQKSMDNHVESGEAETD